MTLFSILVIHSSILLGFVRLEAVSSYLTNGENSTSTTFVNTKLECYELSILRQMIDQETVIRLALVKNVHALIGDVNLIKKSLAVSETTIVELREAVQALNVQVETLLQENSKLKNDSIISKTKMMEQDSKLQTVNHSINAFHERLSVIQKDSETKRLEIINKTNSVLDDVKIEVRYMSVTVLDLKDRLGTEIVPRDNRYKEMERHFNSSLEDLKSENFQTKQEFIFLKTIVKNLTDFRMDREKALSDKSSSHAFSAGISSINGGWSESTLVFPDIIYSEGTGYDPRTGIFTAPSAGTYVFYISIQSYFRAYVRFDIVLNGVTKVQAMANNSGTTPVPIHQTGTNLVVLHLQTGDRVWVRRSSGIGYYSSNGYITTFSGFKLY